MKKGSSCSTAYAIAASMRNGVSHWGRKDLMNQYRPGNNCTERYLIVGSREDRGKAFLGSCLMRRSFEHIRTQSWSFFNMKVDTWSLKQVIQRILNQRHRKVHWRSGYSNITCYKWICTLQYWFKQQYLPRSHHKILLEPNKNFKKMEIFEMLIFSMSIWWWLVCLEVDK